MSTQMSLKDRVKKKGGGMIFFILFCFLVWKTEKKKRVSLYDTLFYFTFIIVELFIILWSIFWSGI